MIESLKSGECSSTLVGDVLVELAELEHAETVLVVADEQTVFVVLEHVPDGHVLLEDVLELVAVQVVEEDVGVHAEHHRRLVHGVDTVEVW